MGVETVYKASGLYTTKKEISGTEESLKAFLISIEKKRKKGIKGKLISIKDRYVKFNIKLTNFDREKPTVEEKISSKTE